MGLSEYNSLNISDLKLMKKNISGNDSYAINILIYYKNSTNCNLQNFKHLTHDL